ncbi:alpha amylase C-terminal domain-containing protein [Halomonas sp. WWR20]
MASHRWHDAVWLRQRWRDDPLVSPLSIYRLYTKAWRHDSRGQPLGWEELAAQLVPYVADLGFTHVEIKGMDEEGAGLAFARFIDACHEGGIGVIVEWPLAPPETPLSESQALEQALDWLESFHLDGLRLMQVAPQGDEAAEPLLRLLLESIAERHADVLLFTEDHLPAAMSQEQAPARALTWNTHWSQATLAYLSQPPEARGAYHNVLIGGLAEAFDAHYVLPLVDEDSAEGASTWLGRMSGDTWQRFANLRACLGFMWAHPGKKLVGMGTEFAQGRGWRQAGKLDWGLLDDPCHAGMLRLVADLNRVYGNEPALHYCDSRPDSFAWVVGDDSTNSVIAFLRYGAEGTAPLLAISNFTPNVLHHYRLGVPALGTWREVLNTDSEFYAGSNVGNAYGVRAQLLPSHGHPASVELTLPPLSTLLLRQGDWPA